MDKFTFETTCVGFPKGKVDDLQNMIDESQEITRGTMRRHLHPEEFLPPVSDWHVRYCKSKLFGEIVYYYVHSAIEHIFTRDGNLLGRNS